MIPVGIDLGTSYSTIAHVNAEGIPTLVPVSRDASEFHTPSLVHLSELGCVVGESVKVLPDEDAIKAVRNSKLQLGDRLPVFQDFQGRDWSAAAINSLVLSKLRYDLQATTFEEISRAVIAVPSHFGDTKRRAVRRAAELADIGVPSLVDESVAAATFLTKDYIQDQTILVYDLGGGSFDASVLRGSRDSLHVLASEGETEIGGSWIDELIMQQMKEAFQSRSHTSLPQSPEVQSQLRRLADDTKISLSSNKNTQVRHSTIIGTEPFKFVLAQTHFERLIQPMLQRTGEIVHRCLQSGNLELGDLDKIYLVGGSTQIHAVRKFIEELVGNAPVEIISRHPENAVAYGAAMLAAKIGAGSNPEGASYRQSIAGYDLGVRIRNPRTGKQAIYNLVKRNSLLPERGKRIFKTSRNDQTRMTIEVVQSKGNPSDAFSLGSFSFGPIAEPKANYPIEVTMQYDSEGLVSVGAKDAVSGREIAHTLTLGGDAATDNFDAERSLVKSVDIIGAEDPLIGIPSLP